MIDNHLYNHSFTIKDIAEWVPEVHSGKRFKLLKALPCMLGIKISSSLFFGGGSMYSIYKRNG